MSIKISKEAYEKLIKEDLDFLNEHCPESLELDHMIVKYLTDLKTNNYGIYNSSVY